MLRAAVFNNDSYLHKGILADFIVISSSLLVRMCLIIQVYEFIGR
jgi:hypothetical protein